MDYEQKYKEALKRAEDFKNGIVHYELNQGESIVNWIFPELRDTRTAENPPINPTRAALDSLKELGYRPRWNPAQRSITFYYFGNKVTFFPKKGYFNGKGLTPGYGLEELLNQLKEKPTPKIQ